MGTDGELIAPDEEREPNTRAVERLTLFSDAVVAIAITLLALDLPVPVPKGTTVSSYWEAVKHDRVDYAAFLISFAVIAGAWANHHDVFRYLTRGDARLRSHNMLWLLTIVLTPFATRVVTSPANGEVLDVHAFRYGFYALVQVVESCALLAMVRHIATQRLASDAAKQVIASMTRQSWVLIAAFGLSIPLFFVFSNAWLLWIAIPVLAGRTLPYLYRHGGRLIGRVRPNRPGARPPAGPDPPEA